MSLGESINILVSVSVCFAEDTFLAITPEEQSDNDPELYRRVADVMGFRSGKILFFVKLPYFSESRRN